MKSLPDVRTTGRNMHKIFVVEFAESSARFEKPLRKIKIKTFASDSVGNRRSKNERLQRMKRTRDLMGRMLIISAKEKLDLKHVLTYPITPVPLALCCSDGTMTKTDKRVTKPYSGSTAVYLLAKCSDSSYFRIREFNMLFTQNIKCGCEHI
ncbi:Hypothetical predicted protein [Octopus vulgaris]|uniref:Uncharacterized protein n=1 Tax=Octopus vulgaris TaxID=6645 RepID=A0AA36ALS0_OCTVU|nr:Hypothetical predicted protein [Octopus vulgaris]